MKDTITRIVLIVVLLVLYVGVNGGVSDLLISQEGMDVALKQGKSMWVGLGRWMSHINWMLLLQKRASISGKPDPAVAEALHRRYDTTTDQDPYLVLAYEHGGVELATIGQPKLGLELLDKGIGVVGETNWKLPSYAAQIVSQYLKDDPDAETKARKYLEQAKKVRGHPFYIESALVRIQSKESQDDPVAMAKLWKEVGTLTGADAAGRFVPEGKNAPELFYGDSGERYSEQAREKVVSILRKVRQDAAQAKDPAQKETLEKQAAEIVKVVKTMIGAEHVCSYCFAEYQAGDKFCPNCGRDVDVYGVCPKCGEVLESAAKFCSHCGVDVSKVGSRKKAAPADSSPAPNQGR
ncbi:MAG: zinc ribbon domain-containing protein [Phycisphaerae bacterium]|nr:zinc ribbon domain-containing protein [Phycisphaerae bacterium]